MSAVTVVHKFLRWLELFALRGAASVLSASEEFTERLTELGVSERVVTVRNGADLSYFTYDGERTTLDTPFFLYAGTASETQGASIFIDALELVLPTHPKATLVFVGQGADWEKLRKLSERFPEGTVRVLDRVAPDRIATWFRGAAASLASLNPGQYDLSFPTRMYASVACGTRVLYAGVGPGSRFAAQPQVGWSVAFDAQEIAGAMRSALDSPISEEASSKLADWAAENVSIQKVTDKGARVALKIAQRQRTEKSRGTKI